MEFTVVKVDGVLVGADEGSAEILASCGAEMEFICKPVPKGKRTNTQNRAMHKYFELLAITLNDAGYDMKKTLKQEAEIPWTKDLVKEYLWRPLQIAMLKKESTTELDTLNPSDVYNVLDRHLSQKFGVSVPWPSNL